MNYVTPHEEVLEDGTYEKVMPSNVEIEGQTCNFVYWEDGSTNPVRNINLIADMAIIATYELAPPPPPGKGYLQIHAFLDTGEIAAPYEVVEAGISGTTPDTVELDSGIYTVNVTHNTETKTQMVEVLEGETTRADFQFAVAPPTPIPPELAIAFIGTSLLYLIVNGRV